MIDEQEPSPEFLKGFNHGYRLAQYEPELLGKILKSVDFNSSNDYLQAMKKAQIQYELDQILMEAERRREDRGPSHELDP